MYTVVMDNDMPRNHRTLVMLSDVRRDADECEDIVTLVNDFNKKHKLVALRIQKDLTIVLISICKHNYKLISRNRVSGVLKHRCTKCHKIYTKHLK